MNAKESRDIAPVTLPMHESSQPPASPTGSRMMSGCLGAMLIHPLLFVLAFLKGFMIGSAQVKVMSATGGSGPTEFLLEGGLNAMGNLAVGYLFVGFIIIPIASLIGSVIAIGIRNQVYHAR